MKSFAKENNGIHFILTVIDTFTKKAWAVPIKRKTGENTAEALKTIISEEEPPKFMQFDEGLEFLNKHVKALLDSKNIRYYSTQSEVKASIVERFNRTLKSRMWKYFTANNTLKYIDVLPELLEGYNKAVHRSTGLPPDEVNWNNAGQVYRKLFPKQKTVEPKFHVGDQVRISINKRPVFDKGYTPNYTMAVYTVSQVWSKTPPTYKLKEYNGDDVQGTFYNEELVKVIVPKDSLFKVEKIVKTRTRNGKKEYLIKWLGYDDSYNSWTSDIQHV